MNRPRSLRSLVRTLVAALSAIATVLGVVVMAVPASAADPVATEITLTVVPQEPEYGGTMTLTAEVSSSGGPVDGGTVEFTALIVPMSPGGWPIEVDLGQQPVEDGVAELEAQAGGASMPGLQEGQVFYVYATYSGVPGELYGSDSTQVLVQPVMGSGEPTPTTTAVTGPESAMAGVATELTASVSPSWAVGTVVFLVDGLPVGAPAEVQDGAASLEHTFTELGSSFVTAIFTPEDSDAFEASEDPTGLTVTVSAAFDIDTTTTVTGPTSATVGVPTTLRALVTPPSAVGWVEFWVDGSPLDGAVEVQDGEASLEHTFTEPGSPIVTAMFLPDDPDVYLPSEDPDGIEVTVTTPAEETTTTVTGPSGATVGVATNLTAEISPTDAEGTVQFSVDGEEVGDPVAVDEGAATESYTFATAGTSTVTAAFTPDDAGEFEASADGTGKSVTVSPPPATPTSTSVTGPGSATVGMPTELVAEVTPSGAAGTVQFFVDGDEVGDPAEVVSGEASVSYTFAEAGPSTVTAAFTPTDDDAFEPSADEEGATVTVSPPPAMPTSTSVTGPASATAGAATTLTATVTPSSAAGTVQFRVSGIAVGAPVPVTAGSASLPHTFPRAGSTTVTAVFTPTDPDAYEGSEDLAGRTVAVSAPPAVATTTTVTGPSGATVATATSLTATVSPAAAGTIQFGVNGRPVGAPVPVSAGTASLAHTFTDGGDASVTATFSPADASAYTSSAGTRSVSVAASPTTTTLRAPARGTVGEKVTLEARVAPVGVAGQVFFTIDGGASMAATITDGIARASYVLPEPGAPKATAWLQPADESDYTWSRSGPKTIVVAAGTSASSTGGPVSTSSMDLSGNSCGSTGARDAARAASLGEILASFDLMSVSPSPAYDAFASGLIGQHVGFDFGVHLYVGVGPCGSLGRATERTVPCALTGTGLTFVCAVGELPAGTEIAVSAQLSLPPELAGVALRLSGSLTVTNPTTGAVTTLDSKSKKITVPKRTVLSASAAPALKKVASVKRGKAVAYRVTVRNAGIFTAQGVRVCASLSKGASARPAKGLTVRGRTACWTVPVLKKGRSATRTVTIVAPRRKGALTTKVVVTPKKSQAAPVRLTVKLPIT